MAGEATGYPDVQLDAASSLSTQLDSIVRIDSVLVHILKTLVPLLCTQTPPQV